MKTTTLMIDNNKDKKNNSCYFHRPRSINAPKRQIRGIPYVPVRVQSVAHKGYFRHNLFFILIFSKIIKDATTIFWIFEIVKIKIKTS